MTAARPRKRTDQLGRAFAGSRLQVQLYVNRRREELNSAISESVNLSADCVIHWRSPLEPSFAEYMDGAFLKALGLAGLREDLRKFWPRSGPRWDGLAVIAGAKKNTASGYLLVEGKSYPSEVYGRGCCSPYESENRQLIDSALALTAKQLSPSHTRAWTGRLYQYANRLAHALFVQNATGLPVWLVNLCFIEDPIKPHSRAAWDDALAGIKRELGFEGRRVPLTADVFLAARDRTELTGAVDGTP